MYTYGRWKCIVGYYIGIQSLSYINEWQVNELFGYFSIAYYYSLYKT